MDLAAIVCPREGVRQQSASTKREQRKIVRLDFRQAKCCPLPGALQQTETTQIIHVTIK
jgi:hypothetical protein